MSLYALSNLPSRKRDALDFKLAQHGPEADLARDVVFDMNLAPPQAPPTPLPSKREDEDGTPRRLSWLPNRMRGHLVAMLGEFLGTFLFLFFAFAGTQVANVDKTASIVAKVLYISLAFGFSLAVNAWVFYRISGGLFNPAVTFALCLTGVLSWTRGALLLLVQVLGAIAAAAVVSAVLPGQMVVRTTLSLAPRTSIARGLFLEMFLTAQLIFTIFMLAAEKHRATFLAPIGIGLSLFIAELAGVLYTGGSLNPARSFGPDVVLGQFNGYHWIYWLGPALGALLAVLVYKLMKKLEYETANPPQDADSPKKDIESIAGVSPEAYHNDLRPSGTHSRHSDTYQTPAEASRR